MPSYRFCRPDDIPDLVAAVNTCYDVSFPDRPPMTVERFRAEMKAFDLWPSNAMLASDGSGPIAVLLGTKRNDAVSVSRIGVRADHRRQGHGRHLLTSLSQKLAVLGPERLVAELPAAAADVQAFFAASGYRREATLVDVVRQPSPIAPVSDELVQLVDVETLAAEGLLGAAGKVAWNRAEKTLRNRAAALSAAAIVTPERIESWLVYDETEDSGIDVLALASRPEPRRITLMTLLLRWLLARTDLPVRLPRLSAGEVPDAVLSSCGFVRGDCVERWAACATPL